MSRAVDLPKRCPGLGIADVADIDKTGIDPKLLEDPLFQELMEEGPAMQERFSAEPGYARTGQGYLKSAGVEEISRVKEEQEDRKESDSETG